MGTDQGLEHANPKDTLLGHICLKYCHSQSTFKNIISFDLCCSRADMISSSFSSEAGVCVCVGGEAGPALILASLYWVH